MQSHLRLAAIPSGSGLPRNPPQSVVVVFDVPLLPVNAFCARQAAFGSVGAASLARRSLGQGGSAAKSSASNFSRGTRAPSHIVMPDGHRACSTRNFSDKLFQENPAK